MHRTHDFLKPLLCIILCIIFSSALSARETGTLFSLSLDELINVEIVTAGKMPEKIKDIPASVVLISRTDIEKYGYTTLTDILENAPGLYNIYSYAGVSGNFGVRGFWNPNSQNSNIVFLVNGIRQTSDNDRSNPFEKINIPVEAIDRIEIIRGPMAILYGNGAAFGVINIITNEVSDGRENQSLLSLTYGSMGTNKAAYRLAVKENNLKFVINAAHFQTEGPDNRFSDMMSPDNLTVLPSLGVNSPDYRTKDLLSQDSKYVGLSGSYNNWLFDMAYNESKIGLFFLVPSLGEGFYRTNKNTSMMLGYQKELSSKIKVDFRGIYNSNSLFSQGELLVSNVDAAQYISLNSLEFELLLNITPNNKTHIIVGINHRTVSDLREATEAPALGVVDGFFEKSDQQTQALFSQITYQAMRNLSLVAGVRYEDILPYEVKGVLNNGLPGQARFGGTRGDFQSTSPRLAAVYTLDESNVLKFLYGEANRTIHDTLDPEITKTSEINYIHSRNDVIASLSLFQNQLQDLIINDLVFEGGGVNSRQRNGGEITTNGIELIVNHHLTDTLSAEFSMTLQKSIDENNKNIDVAYSPQIVAHGKLVYRAKNTILSALGRYISAMEPFYDFTQSNSDGSFGARVGEKINDYFVLDLNIRQDNLYKGIYLNVKISNALNQEIRYPNSLDTNTLLNRGTIGAERMFFASIGIKF
ncbi:MAG: TonB-dependent receptor [Ectothiorhodospiraceae bacterium]|nr:TonB-dependent receptor [Ectothiorhodospiraceae bacterium]